MLVPRNIGKESNTFLLGGLMAVVVLMFVMSPVLWCCKMSSVTLQVAVKMRMQCMNTDSQIAGYQERKEGNIFLYGTYPEHAFL